MIGTQILKQTPKKWLGWHVLLLLTLNTNNTKQDYYAFFSGLSSLILDMGLFIKF